MNSYMKISCNGSDYYYNIKSDVTITEYKVNAEAIENTFEIKYQKGNICLD